MDDRSEQTATSAALREWVRRARADCHMSLRELEAIADHIDRELVELPKDAHGEYIRVGDTLDGYGKTIEVVEMRYGRGGWVLISRDGSGYADTFAFAHHHEPTVEDVLREACNAYHSLLIEGMSDVAHDMPAPSEIIAEYSAKLRLANDGEEQ